MKNITEYPYDPSLLTDRKYFWNCRTKEDLAAYHKKLARRSDNDYQALLSITQNNRKLFSLINSTQTFPGWCSLQKGAALAALVTTLKPATVIEVGVFGGRSLLPMAMAVQDAGLPTKIIGIDPFLATESIKNEQGANLTWWNDQSKHDEVLEKLLFYLKKFQMEGIVELVKKPSNDFTPVECDLLHLDGNHCDQALVDAQRFGLMVRLGGVVVNDDLMWGAGYVLRSLDALEDIGFVEVARTTTGGDCWNIMQRIKI